MKNNKKAWQIFVYYLGISSFMSSIACLATLYFMMDGLNVKNTISASIMASSFFFASVGVVLITIGKCNIPSFKVDNADT